VRQGALLVGPESAGAVPGPACYGRGGLRATVTDADCVLGYLPVDRFAAGRMRLDPEAARTAIARDVATPLGLDLAEAAWAVERVVNANMANAVRTVVAAHGADPRELTMIAYGGNGPVHAWLQARELGIGRVLVPKASPAFSALGLLVADYVADVVRAYVAPLFRLDRGRVRYLMGELADEVTKELAPSGLGPEQIAMTYFLDMCYQGQNFDLRVPVSEGGDLGDPVGLVERFHAQHERDRGFCSPSRAVLVRGVRLVARGTTPKPRLAPRAARAEGSVAVTQERLAHLGEGFQSVPVHDGALLGTGAVVHGPA